MSYEKNTWVTGDVITADKMNNIENGIEAIEETLDNKNVTSTHDDNGNVTITFS